MKEAEKIYDVKKSIKNKIVIKNFTKSAFIMNLESEILAFKKGYFIDSVNLQINQGRSYLKYVGHDTIVHLSNQTFEIYDYRLDTSVRPYRVKVKSKDCMSLKLPPESRFFDVLPISNGNYVVFLTQDKQSSRKRGELTYWLAVTLPIELEKKIDLLFPKRKYPFLKNE